MRIEKDWTELDFTKVDFKSGEWLLGCGGLPLLDDQYAITYINSEDLSETRYKLPECLNQKCYKQ